MNRLPEAVNQQFNQLFAVISKAGDNLRLESAEASMSGNFEAVAMSNGFENFPSKSVE